ncbi:MAG TPA: hypothetical protein VFR70_03845 [Flavobacterium sp.]|nr:hypothetical protein [Flavobacterium sp.]
MQLRKNLFFWLFLLIYLGGHSQEFKKIEYLFLNRDCDTIYYGIAKDNSRASFFVYIDGYHVKAKRDSLAEAQMKRRRDFPNVIPSGPEPFFSADFWGISRKNVSKIDNLPYITLEEFYKDTSKYYISNRLFFIVPKKDGTFDIWKTRLMGQE